MKRKKKDFGTISTYVMIIAILIFLINLFVGYPTLDITNKIIISAMILIIFLWGIIRGKK